MKRLKMKRSLIVLIFLGISMMSRAQSEIKDMMQFEKDIAYFYDASDPEKIANHYLEALKQLEILGTNVSDEVLESKMLPALVQAYAEVAKQTHLEFDTTEAAKLELSLILSQAKKAPFDKIQNIMQNLYKEIFKSDLYSIQKAAMLRTFLYRYKISVMQNENTFTENDKKLMLLLAKMSEEELQNIK